MAFIYSYCLILWLSCCLKFRAYNLCAISSDLVTSVIHNLPQQPILTEKFLLFSIFETYFLESFQFFAIKYTIFVEGKLVISVYQIVMRDTKNCPFTGSISWAIHSNSLNAILSIEYGEWTNGHKYHSRLQCLYIMLMQ